MKARNIENGLALVGALIVFIGVSFAAESALAKESTDVTTAATAADDTRKDAAQANSEAAKQAARSLALENWIELDIKFDDHTSTLAAGEK